MNNDIVFISYGEGEADANFERILNLVSHGGIARVKDVTGIPDAHLVAALKAGTDWFYVVDGDSYVCEDFRFDYVPDASEDTTHVWHARNPYNGLEYGYGGIKMFHRRTLINRLKTFEMGADMSTGLFDNFKVIEEVASETRFATDAFSAWRGAFRECVKLSAQAIDRQVGDETSQRLNAWTSAATGKFSFEIRGGAREGKEYGNKWFGYKNRLKKINDYEWLKEQFLK